MVGNDPETDGYWAAAEGEKLCGILDDREQRWYDFVERRGYVDMWLEMLSEVYGIQKTALLGFDATGPALEGEYGELIRFRINELRSYIGLAVTTTTKQRAAFQAKTTSTESKNEYQVDVAEDIIDAIYGQWYGEERERRLVERGEYFATMYTWLQWDDEGGEMADEPVMLADGQQTPQMRRVPTPSIVAKVLPPWQVICDPLVEFEEDALWYCVRERRSRWEMLEQYGYVDVIDEMTGMPVIDPETGEPERVESEFYETIKSTTAYNARGYEALFGFDDGEVSEDDIVVRHFLHKDCRAMRGGRYACCIGDKVVYEKPIDGDLPVYRYQPSEFVGSALGYSSSWDLVGPNQMQTQLISDAATNLSTFGRQSVTVEKGVELSEEQLANGMHLIRIPKGAAPPQALQLTEIASGAQWFLGFLEKKMQNVSGQNSVTRGDPSSNIKSGTMAALFASIAQDYQHGRQMALDLHREKVANGMLQMIRRNAPDRLIVDVVGKHDRAYIGEFREDTFRAIPRVRLKPIAATLRTRAGQLEMANYLKDVPGAIQSPEQAIEIFTQGHVTALYNASRAAITRVRWENEQFATEQVTVEEVPGEPELDPMTGEPMIDPMTGQPVPGPPVQRTAETPVLPTDNPFLHIPEHAAEFASSETLNNPNKRAAILAHIAEHVRTYQGMDPIMCAILKIPPPQAVMGGGAPPGPPDMGEMKPGKLHEQAADENAGLPKPPAPPNVQAAG